MRITAESATAYKSDHISGIYHLTQGYLGTIRPYMIIETGATVSVSNANIVPGGIFSGCSAVALVVLILPDCNNPSGSSSYYCHVIIVHHVPPKRPEIYIHAAMSIIGPRAAIPVLYSTCRCIP